MKAKIDIYVVDRFLGSIGTCLFSHPFVRTEEEIKKEVEQRIPTLKNKKYQITIS